MHEFNWNGIKKSFSSLFYIHTNHSPLLMQLFVDCVMCSIFAFFNFFFSIRDISPNSLRLLKKKKWQSFKFPSFDSFFVINSTFANSVRGLSLIRILLLIYCRAAAEGKWEEGKWETLSRFQSIPTFFPSISYILLRSVCHRRHFMQSFHAWHKSWVEAKIFSLQF